MAPPIKVFKTGGAQELLGIKADLVTFGKIIGGGMPVGAVAGPAEIMKNLAPSGKVYQAGTLSGNPIAMIAGFTMLRTLKENPDIYSRLEEKSAGLEKGLKESLRAGGTICRINRCGSMMSVFFTEYPVTDFLSASGANNQLFKNFFHGMLEEGVYLPPSPFESWFISDALGEEELGKTIEAAKRVMERLGNETHG
jgi:glutamate-1-semialdehyde 2,1-aminomutase